MFLYLLPYHAERWETTDNTLKKFNYLELRNIVLYFRWIH